MPALQALGRPRDSPLEALVEQGHPAQVGRSRTDKPSITLLTASHAPTMYASSLFTPRRNQASGAAAYRSHAIEIEVASADAHRLVSILFAGFEQSIAEALGALEARDTERKCRALTRAIRIIDDGLRAHLDMAAGGTLARDLQDLYGYVVQRLTLANARNDPAMLTECQRLIQPLAEAWNSIQPQRAADR